MRGTTQALALFFCLSAALAQSTGDARGFIGVAVTDTTRGAVVGPVQPGGPADKGGLKTGDIVLEVNSTPIDRAATMTRLVSALAPGATVRLKVMRANTQLMIAIMVGTPGPERERPASGTGLPAPAPSAPAPSAPAPALVVSGYTRLTDPIEQAFTVEVPSGWRSEAGLARLGLIHINPYVRALSPDKMTYLLVGEPTMPSFAPPTDIGTKLGIREGALSSNGLDRVLVWHYLSGIEFARAYGQMALGQLCRDLKFVSTQQRPDLASIMEKLLPTVIPSRSSGGEAVFSCTHNRQEMTARVESVTRTTQDNVIWGPLLVQGLIAPRSQANGAQSVLNHVSGSIQFSQAWTQKQSALSQQAGQAINARVAQQERQQAAFIEKLNSVDENFQDVDELITGNSHYKDPRTGKDYFLNNANPNKWVDDYGRVIGTQTNIPPPFGYNYQPLQHVYQ